MAITKFTEDLNIIAKQPNYPGSEGGLTPAQFRAEFDKAGLLIKQYLNESLIPELDQIVDVQALLNGILDSTLSEPDKAANARAVGMALDEKLSLSGGTMTGPIAMGGKKITGLAAPTESGDGANKDYVDNTVKNARSKATVTLTAAGWSEENMQTVAVAGVTADEAVTDVIAAPGTADENYAAYVENAVRIYSQNDGSVTFKCEFIPEADIAVNVMVLK